MNKKFFKECVNVEVYHWAGTQNPSLFRKIWLKYFQPESNAVYLVRKCQYHNSQKGFVHVLKSRLLETKLMRRYGIFIGRKCSIDIGFRIWHPHGIIINNSKIGKNLNMSQNTTIGAKVHGSTLLPVIGNNCTMYTGSMIIGAFV